MAISWYNHPMTKAPKASTAPLPPAFMRGVPEGRGEFAAVGIRRNAATEATLYRILPPGLRPAPLVNEGGKRVLCWPTNLSNRNIPPEDCHGLRPRNDMRTCCLLRLVWLGNHPTCSAGAVPHALQSSGNNCRSQTTRVQLDIRPAQCGTVCPRGLPGVKNKTRRPPPRVDHTSLTRHSTSTMWDSLPPGLPGVKNKTRRPPPRVDHTCFTRLSIRNMSDSLPPGAPR